MFFSDLVHINPAVKLVKGKKYPFIAMEEVVPSQRYVQPQKNREYKGGGAKFLASDVLFARITPCLENGKVAQFQNSKSQTGFGSTEFFIFRARPGKADPGFIYYLASSDLIKKPAEKSMSGASGRQRAALDSVIEAKVPFYPLPTQRKISSILSAYDDLIENNLGRIKILEAMAQNLYREWFVKFRFPGHKKARFVDSPLGKIPEGWGVICVKELVQRIPSGKKYDNKTAKPKGNVPVLDQGRSGIIGYHDEEPGVFASAESPVIVFANHTCYQRLVTFPFSAIQNVLPFLSNRECLRDIYWLHYSTKDLVVFNDYKGHWPEFMNKSTTLPPKDICSDFGGFVRPMIQLLVKLESQNQTLRKTRDMLLPKLISGEVDVSDLNIKIPEETEV